MNPTLKNTLALVSGVVIGGIINSGIVNFGPSVIPLPEGADISTMEGLKESMALFAPINFLPPFLAHALGTLVGAFVAAKLAASHSFVFAISIGGIFSLGGITMVVLLGGPMWFVIADLVLAYIPMAYLGAVLAGSTKK